MNERTHRQKIDDLDLDIINLLERDGRFHNTELAKRLNSSEATIRKRIKRLIDGGLSRLWRYETDPSSDIGPMGISD